MAVRKKLIEVSLPLEAINTASAKEKAIRQGHPSALHLWWARRPLAACRAVIFAQLVDDPSSWPDRFPTEASQEAERKRLHDLIARMVPWEACRNETILSEARLEIAKSVAWNRDEDPPPAGDPAAVFDYLQTKAPPIYDPFCGGGAIPLEAQRLGLRAYGSDLNPVAVLVSKALVELPPKFAGLPPVNPEAQAALARGGSWSGRGAEGLAEDVRYYGRRMREKAENRIGHLYPRALAPDGTEATVIAWLWARTVRSPDPAVKGAMVPLVSSFVISKKEGRKSWVELAIDPKARDGWSFHVKTGTLTKEKQEQLENGTSSGRGNARCALTQTPIPDTWIRAEGTAGRLGCRLMAIVAEGIRGRVYLSPDAKHENLAYSTEPAWKPEGELFEKALGFRVPNYGMKRWSDLFTQRQLVGLTTYCDLVGEVRSEILSAARDARQFSPATESHERGGTPDAYADTIATYLAFAVDKLADLGNSLCRWEPIAQCPRQLFGRQAIPMIWDFAEGNPLGDSSGSWQVCLNGIARAMATSIPDQRLLVPAIISVRAAQDNAFPDGTVISCDPPYYDNIGYADLSDFFYVWLRRSLRDVWPDLFRRLLTAKDEELVATPARHGGGEKAELFFMEGMARALRAMHAVTGQDVPISIFYAFKQSDAAEGGLVSAGWAAFLEAVTGAGLVVDGTWPVRTENASRMRGQSSNALASSVVLACRRRDANAPATTRGEFVRALRREMPGALLKIQEAGIQAVDFQQAAIGPGMGVFSRYAKVMEADDSAMTVRAALMLINSLIEELASEQDASYDPDTQAALVWFQNYGWTEQLSGQAITLATSKNTALDALFRSGVFIDLRGKVRLTKRAELPTDWKPAGGRHVTLWEAAQYLARTLDAEDGGIDAAAHILAALGTRAADVLPLVYRLYQIAGEQRKDATEALVWNRLQAEWPTIERRAAELAETPLPAMPTLFDRGAAQ